MATVIPVVVIAIVVAIVAYICYRNRRIKVASEDSFADLGSRPGSGDSTFVDKPSRDVIKVEDVKKLDFNLSEEDD